MVKSLRAGCVELLTEIEARLDFDDEMPPIDLNMVVAKIQSMLHEVDSALETANHEKLLQSGVQVPILVEYRIIWFVKKESHPIEQCAMPSLQYIYKLPLSYFQFLRACTDIASICR